MIRNILENFLNQDTNWNIGQNFYQLNKRIFHLFIVNFQVCGR